MDAPPVVGSPHHPLAHLPRCPDCNFYLSAPQLCKGLRTPEFDGLWYRKCFHNFEPVDTSCKHFKFTDLPRGHDAHPQLQIKCPGLGCKDARAPNAVNINCLSGLCKQCCIRAQATVPGLRSCTVSSHNEGRRRGQVAGVVAAAAPAVPAPLIIPNWVPPPPPAPVHAGQQPAAPAPAPPAQAVPPPAPAPPAQAVPPPVAPPAQAVPPPAPAPAVAPPPAPQQAATVTVTAPNVMPTAAMIDPALLAAPHLPSSDSAQITLAEDANDEMRFNQQLAHTKMLEFWDVDGGMSQGYTVRIPNWPGFHPKDSPELVEAYRVDQVTCQYWDDVRCRWWNCSPTSPPRNVKVVDVLYYRAMGVTTGIDMPGLSFTEATPSSTSLGKRRADDAGDSLYDRSGACSEVRLSLRLPSSFATPSKRIAVMPMTPSSNRSARSWPVTPASGRSRGHSVPPTPSTSSSRASATPSTSGSWSTPRHIRDTSPSPFARSPTWSGLDDFPDDVTYTDSPQPSDSSSSSAVGLPAPAPSADLGVDFDPATVDLSDAPPGPNKWPLRYVCDMAAGFARMRYLEDHALMKRIPAFEAAFGVDFKKSTFHQNFNAWNDASLTPGEQARWISYGRDRRDYTACMYSYDGTRDGLENLYSPPAVLNGSIACSNSGRGVSHGQSDSRTTRIRRMVVTTADGCLATSSYQYVSAKLGLTRDRAFVVLMAQSPCVGGTSFASSPLPTSTTLTALSSAMSDHDYDLEPRDSFTRAQLKSYRVDGLRALITAWSGESSTWSKRQCIEYAEAEDVTVDWVRVHEWLAQKDVTDPPLRPTAPDIDERHWAVDRAMFKAILKGDCQAPKQPLFDPRQRQAHPREPLRRAPEQITFQDHDGDPDWDFSDAEPARASAPPSADGHDSEPDIPQTQAELTHGDVQRASISRTEAIPAPDLGREDVSSRGHAEGSRRSHRDGRHVGQVVADERDSHGDGEGAMGRFPNDDHAQPPAVPVTFDLFAPGIDDGEEVWAGIMKQRWKALCAGNFLDKDYKPPQDALPSSDDDDDGEKDDDGEVQEGLEWDTLDENDPLWEYHAYVQDQPAPVSTVPLLDKNSELWPGRKYLHGRGNILGYGMDYRAVEPNGQPRAVSVLLPDVWMMYEHSSYTFTARSHDLATALHKSALLIEGNVYLRLPLLVGEMRSSADLAAIDSDGGIHLDSACFDVELNLLKKYMNDHKMLKNTFFSFAFDLYAAFNKIPVKRGRTISMENVTPPGAPATRDSVVDPHAPSYGVHLPPGLPYGMPDGWFGPRTPFIGAPLIQPAPVLPVAPPDTLYQAQHPRIPSPPREAPTLVDAPVNAPARNAPARNVPARDSTATTKPLATNSRSAAVGPVVAQKDRHSMPPPKDNADDARKPRTGQAGLGRSTHGVPPGARAHARATTGPPAPAPRHPLRKERPARAPSNERPPTPGGSTLTATTRDTSYREASAADFPDGHFTHSASEAEDVGLSAKARGKQKQKEPVQPRGPQAGPSNQGGTELDTDDDDEGLEHSQAIAQAHAQLANATQESVRESLVRTLTYSIWEAHPVVAQMRRASEDRADKGAREVDRLVEWCTVINALMGLPSPLGTIGRLKVSSIVIGIFLKHKDDWVQNAMKAWKIIAKRYQYPAVDRWLEANGNVVMGMTRFYQALAALKKGDKPPNH
ncbi:hypothetical protein K466DRAFT_609467 [Polyporus arcularius HHB13444]|uniref:Uncharacterized protein n=1 Tax=Polyporus arcularius HHB13444 TaxID=1314778 RepID=A0A5C3NSA3_9APHY|nr:hypothetical protein K466DRAFT_609467 [Polyporus arcularius HHB13444]